MLCQMMRVISSPSSSTTGFATLILAMVFSGSLHGCAAYGSAMATASTAAPNAAKASTSEAFRRDESRPAQRAGRGSQASGPAAVAADAADAAGSRDPRDGRGRAARWLAGAAASGGRGVETSGG